MKSSHSNEYELSESPTMPTCFYNFDRHAIRIKIPWPGKAIIIASTLNQAIYFACL